MGCHSLLQGMFPTWGLNPGFPHYRQIFLPPEPPAIYKELGLRWLFVCFFNLKMSETGVCLNSEEESPIEKDKGIIKVIT